jgi:hypothetical protein
MDEYRKIVVGIAVFIFILTMIVFWFLSPVKSKIFPPVISDCPTGWPLTQDGSCNIPTDGMNIGNLKGKGVPIYKKINSDGTVTYSTDKNNGGVIFTDQYGKPVLAYTEKEFPAGYDVNNPQYNVVNFTDIGWSSFGSTLCANREWAIQNNIVWEGVSNFNHCKE